MGTGAVKDGAALGRDRRIPKSFSFRDHARPFPPLLLREPFVACPRSSSFAWRKRLCFLTFLKRSGQTPRLTTCNCGGQRKTKRYDWTKKNCKIYLEGTLEREVVQKDVRFLGFESFLWEKNLTRVLRSFPRDSSTWFVGVRWLLLCLYPNSEPCTLYIAEIFRFFPEVDLEYWHVNVEKFTGRVLFHEKHTSNFSRSREVNFWMFFSNRSSPSRNLETAQGRRWRQGRMVVRNFRRQ